MLTIAYCRVSTEDQAEEGYSIEGQTDKLRMYSEFRNLGEITVITDPGLSGKNMKRPGLQQILAMVEAGHVANVLVWRLDRLSRNLGDLILLADLFGNNNVALHSVSENLDLSSAAGRMFYNILGTFAQYFRESLSENVRMGNDRAVREGKWINRPKTGYGLVGGELIPNTDAPRIVEIFSLRARGCSYREIEDQVGIKYSTVSAILSSKIYLGQVLHNGEWFPGTHEALIADEIWLAAQRTNTTGKRRSKDLLSGRVLCGLCNRKMTVNQNGQGQLGYRCHHRGKGCQLPSRSNKGLARAAVKGMTLISGDEDLQRAIRRKLDGRASDAAATVRPKRPSGPKMTLATLSNRRRKLLDLYYAGKISQDGFEAEEKELAHSIEALRHQEALSQAESHLKDDLEQKFEEVVSMLASLDIEQIFEAATHQEKKVLVENLLEWIKVFPDYLEVKIQGCPAIKIRPSEVGLKDSEIVGVEGGT